MVRRQAPGRRGGPHAVFARQRLTAAGLWRHLIVSGMLLVRL
jgi:hypothetical protein